MNDDAELGAIQVALATLQPLDAEAQARVWGYVRQRLGIDISPSSPSVQQDGPQLDGDLRPNGHTIGKPQSFAELYDRVRPATNPIRALIGGYWLQVCGGQPDFDSFRLNKELQHLGHQLSNVTYALTELNKKKPALAMQVRKSGKSAQARKRYRLTESGIKMVEEMIKSSGA